MFHALCTLKRYLSATGWTVPVLYRQSVSIAPNITSCTVALS
ncbi:hypothetical protein AB02_4765 [Escherichia coli 2-222-05_S1_C1]|nr:hypothetical protein AC95_2195 [Escherichia coli 2-052-05_S4_C2]KDX63048.1 hypothetical protein AB02_4765 [Escherichia coli 2-222-05_S1_C1]KDX70961.1 hypothetical protein AB31_4834 [Escherichia coli 2-222-05_S1_C2]KDX75360.1 hypothetical protein AB63_4738 [Escherichia coli 2-222-05_S1_C3]